MLETEVAIIGGGLAGLNAARLLHGAGVDFQLFEARDRLGGRILTVDEAGAPADTGFDLGPSWFWPQMQPSIGALVRELGLSSFPQASDGDLMFERTPHEGPKRYPGMRQEPQSMRLSGGTGALVHRIAQDLPRDRLHLGTPVEALMMEGARVVMCLPGRKISAGHVIAALPPRIMAEAIRLTPALTAGTLDLWRDTATWMAPHAKFLALYDRPFWREAGLSGTAQSMVGPMAEIHDASTADGRAALFGFLGISPGERARLGQDVLTRACVQQLARLFGPKAAQPRATLFKDWAADPMTATASDQQASGHPHPATSRVGGDWAGVLSLAGSEVSPTEPGYLSGAAEASSRAVQAFLAARA
jgi:monoamine oxidase